MSCRAWIWTTLSLCACAAAPTVPDPTLVTRQSPGLEGVPKRVEPNAKGPAGYFPLPAALAVDPAKIPIAPLDLKVIKPERLVLDNGLTVYLIEDHAVPLINLRALVAAGKVDEPADKVGVAELTFELMGSGGAGNLTAEALDEQLEYLAADAGGGAGEETSSFELNLRSVDLNKLMPVFGQMLLKPAFQADRFAVTVARELEGIRRRPDSPDGLAIRAVRKAVFGPTSVFGRETTEKTLKAVTLADLRAFHQRVVVPKATRLLVTGDFDRASMLERLRKEFSAWKGGERPVRNYAAAAPLQRRVILVPKQIAQAKIRIGGPGFQRLSPREYAMRVMSTALGSFGVGRLFREVRDRRGLAYSAFAQVSPGPTTGMFLAGADTRPETAAQAIEATLGILTDSAGKNPFSKGEIATASDMFLNSFAFRFDSAEKVTQEKAVFDQFGYPDDYLDRYRENISKVDSAATVDALKQVTRPEVLQIVVVGPPEKMGDLSKFGPVTTLTDVEAFR